LRRAIDQQSVGLAAWRLASSRPTVSGGIIIIIIIQVDGCKGDHCFLLTSSNSLAIEGQL